MVNQQSSEPSQESTQSNSDRKEYVILPSDLDTPTQKYLNAQPAPLQIVSNHIQVINNKNQNVIIKIVNQL
jgi:hypothetical protein